MAADYELHVIKTDEELYQFSLYRKSEVWSSEDGHGYFEYLLPDGNWYSHLNFPPTFSHNDVQEMREVFLPDLNENVVFNTEGVWCGEVSWLKAALLENVEEFVPSVIEQLNELVENFPIINEQSIEQISSLFDLPNTTQYEIAKKEDVIKFLQNNLGHRVYGLSF